MSAAPNQAADRPARSEDERALFNPVYIAAIIAAGASAHRREHKAELPLPLAWTLPVMSAPRAIREQLPRTVRPYLAKWLEDNPLVRVNLRRLAPLYAPSTRQALRFGVRHEMLTLTPGGVQDGHHSKALMAHAPPEVAESLAAARLLARWLPRAGPLPTVYTLLGLRP